MAKHTIYYDTRTNNVSKFVSKLCTTYPGEFEGIKITNDLIPSTSGHLITYTTKIGEAPQSTITFAEKFATQLKSVSASGNKNWGKHFAGALDAIHLTHNIPQGIKFELAGFSTDLKKYYLLVNNS